MPKLDLRHAKRIKVLGGEVERLKGAGFDWQKPGPAPSGGERLPLAFDQSSAYGTPPMVATVANMRDENYTTGAGTQTSYPTPFINYIRADLGVPMRVNRVRVAGGDIPGWGGVASYVNGCTVRYRDSLDVPVADWNIAVAISGVTDADPYIVDFPFVPITARYWALVSGSGEYYLAATEFRLYDDD